jgi:serine/threonine protein kinase
MFMCVQCYFKHMCACGRAAVRCKHTMTDSLRSSQVASLSSAAHCGGSCRCLLPLNTKHDVSSRAPPDPSCCCCVVVTRAHALVHQAKDCVRLMLVRDPRKRPDAATILAHEWMQGGSSAPEAPMQPEILQRMRRFANMNRFKKEALRVRRAWAQGSSYKCTWGVVQAIVSVLVSTRRVHQNEHSRCIPSAAQTGTFAGCCYCLHTTCSL